MDDVLCEKGLAWPCETKYSCGNVFAYIFQLRKKTKDDDLLNPSGLLSEMVPSTSTEEASKEVDA